MTTSRPPCAANRSRMAASRSGVWPRVTSRSASPLPARPAANVTRSPTSAATVARAITAGSQRRPVVVAIAAAAPTTAPVGTTGTIEPSSTPAPRAG